MFTVKNLTDVSQNFQAINNDGGFLNVNLAPGESGKFEIDPLQGRFQEGGPLKATPIGPEAKAELKAVMATITTDKA